MKYVIFSELPPGYYKIVLEKPYRLIGDTVCLGERYGNRGLRFPVRIDISGIVFQVLDTEKESDIERLELLKMIYPEQFLGNR